MIGFHSFIFGTNATIGGSGTNYLDPNFSGFFDPSSRLNQINSGGSADGTYGNMVAVDGSAPGVNNGYANMYAGDVSFLQLQNNSGATVNLGELLYDGFSNPSSSVTIGYRYGITGIFENLVTTALTGSYQSFSHDISSLQLNDGQIVQFQFAGGIGGQLDNFGITAVPEPSGALITCGLLGMFAMRRRHA